MYVDSVFIEKLFVREHGDFGGFEHGVETAQHGEGQDHVAVFAPYIHVAKTVVGNVPDEVGDLFEL